MDDFSGCLPDSLPDGIHRLRPGAGFLKRSNASSRARLRKSSLGGDSVTTYGRWQSMFLERLKDRYPQGDIELVTEARGGRNTDSYLAEPRGSEHNYREKVLESRPHLIVSAF